MKQSRLAQRKLKEIKNTQKPKKNRKKLYFLLAGILFLVIVILGILVFGHGSVWDGRFKISIAVQDDKANTSIIILDPQSSSITDLEIPMNTQVQAANQLGTWKIGSIGKLGNDKKLGGVFLKNTIIKSFSFPVDAWGNGGILDLTSNNIFKIVKSLFANDSTNLSMLDKIRVGFFSLNVGNTGRNEIKLENSSYLLRSQLPDGSLGYLVSDNIPGFIEAYFVDTNINISGLNVLINKQGTVGEDLMVAKTVQVLGANIASIQSLPSEKFDCKVKGENSRVVLSIARVFSCDTNFSKPSDNFDIQIDLGSYFNNRF